MLLWAVGGGKGGTGKSLVANGLALHLALGGRSVVLVDADYGGANQHTYCGLRHPGHTLGQFFEAGLPLEALAQETAVPGLRLVPGNLNSAHATGFNSAQKLKLFRHLRRMEADHVVLDLGAGTTLDILDSFLLADVKVAVLTPEILAVENLYLFVKNLQFRLLGAVLADFHLRDAAREAWKERAGLGIATVMDLAAHMAMGREDFAEAFERQRRRLAMHLVLNEVREFRQVDVALAARSAVLKFFQVPVSFDGFIHHDKDLWHLFGKGANLVLRGASFAMTHDLQSILAGILRTEERWNPKP